jgi:hypothetical protein
LASADNIENIMVFGLGGSENRERSNSSFPILYYNKWKKNCNVSETTTSL